MAAERRSEMSDSLVRESFAVELIPVPRAISSACGFCLLFSRQGGRDADLNADLDAESCGKAIMDFARVSGAEAVYQVTEIEIAGKKRKGKNYERIGIDNGD